jgi:hypothetical protein
MKIQPVTTWANGVEQQADGFLMNIAWDNMSTSATFQYQLVKISDSWEQQVLVSGTLIIDGTDYQTWDADPSANAWAYNWAAAKLNLTLILDEVAA